MYTFRTQALMNISDNILLKLNLLQNKQNVRFQKIFISINYQFDYKYRNSSYMSTQIIKIKIIIFSNQTKLHKTFEFSCFVRQQILILIIY